MCFNALNDHCTTMDTISFISWLPDDYSITDLQESFPYYAKNGQKSQCFTICINEHIQRQTKCSFFYFFNEVNDKIDRPMLENSRASNSRVFILGVLSKFPTLKTSIFRIAGQPFIRWIRVIRSLSDLCLNCNHCQYKYYFVHILNSRQWIRREKQLWTFQFTSLQAEISWHQFLHRMVRKILHLPN